MFANLQNKINLKKLNEDNIDVSNDFIFRESFSIVNSTIDYFKKDKHNINDIIFKEEFVEFEDGETISFLNRYLNEEQKYIYNNNILLEEIKGREIDEDIKNILDINQGRYLKQKGYLSSLLEDKNEEIKTELDQYRMVDHELEDSEDYDVKDLFDSDTIDIARNEYLDHIMSIDWLDKKLISFKNEMNEKIKSGNCVTIENNLKKLDINNTEEIKNKIKDVHGTIKLLKEKRGLIEDIQNKKINNNIRGEKNE